LISADRIGIEIYAEPVFLVSLYIPDANPGSLRTMEALRGAFYNALGELEVSRF